jgi:hypothetical protein
MRVMLSGFSPKVDKVRSDPLTDKKNTYLCANLIFEIAPQRRGLELPF